MCFGQVICRKKKNESMKLALQQFHFISFNAMYIFMNLSTDINTCEDI